jgi:hypothetical protein
MEYTLILTLDVPFEEACLRYGDHREMLQWEKGLTRIETVPGSDTSVYLVFEQSNAVQRMKETILEWNAPERHDAVYEMGPVWNRCLSVFEQDGNKTKWTMHVEFRNVESFQLPISSFEQKTLMGMMSFKNYAEALYAR